MPPIFPSHPVSYLESTVITEPINTGDWLDEAANVSAAIGDTLSFGISYLGRQAVGYALDVPDLIDYKGTGYWAGGWVGNVVDFFSGGGLSAVKGIGKGALTLGTKVVAKAFADDAGKIIGREAAEQATKLVDNVSAKALREFDVTSLKNFKKFPRDNLTGHELLQSVWLRKHLNKGRSSSLGGQNPAIALTEAGYHKLISKLQAEAGLHSGKLIAGQSARRNILENVKILKEAGVPRAKILELLKNTRKFIQDIGL